MPDSKMRKSWKTRVWAWRVAMVALVALPLPSLAWLATRHAISMPGAAARLFVSIILAVMAGVFAEKAQDRGTLRDADRSILGRFRTSNLLLVAVIVAVGCLIPSCMNFLRSELHFSIAEAFAAVSVPYWLAGAKLSRIFRGSAGSDSDTLRAHALLIDRDRRQFAWFYAVIAFMWLLEIGTWWPQAERALNGQTVNLGQLHVFGIFAVSSLFLLYGPRRLFDSDRFASMAEDETLAATRERAFRYGFFTLAVGMIGMLDLLLRNPRLAMVMLPVLFGLSQIVGFLTITIREFLAARLGDEDDDTGAPGAVDFRGNTAGI
jgi:hypothetical protein